MNALQFPVDTNYDQLNRWIKFGVFFLALMCMALSSAMAQQQPSQILNNALASFQASMSGVENQMLGVARQIFLSLLTVEVIWAGVKYVLDRDNPASLIKDLTALLVQRVVVGIVVWNGPQFMRMITSSFTQLGQQVSNGVSTNSASGLVDTGLQAMTTMWNTASVGNFFSSPAITLVSILVGVVLLLSFVVAGLQMFMTQVEFYIVASGAVFMLGFFGSKVTKQFSEKYISFVIGAGIKMFTIYLVMGAAMPMLNSAVALAQTTSPDMAQLGTVLASTIVVAFLTWSIPGLAASIAAGTVNTNAAGLIGTAGSMAAGGIAAAGAGAIAAKQVGAAGAGAASGFSGARSFYNASTAGGQSSMAAMGSTARASLGAAGHAIGSKVADAVGGSSAIQNSLGGRAGAAMSGQAEQMMAAMPAGGAPAPGTGGGSATSAPSVDSSSAPTPGATQAGDAGAGSTAAASTASAPAAAPSVERGSASSAAPRVAPPPVAGGPTFSQQLGEIGQSMAPPPEATASVGAGFSFHSDH